jgi:hypothetical protein
MTPHKNQPARTTGTPLPGANEHPSSEPDGEHIIALSPAPRRWLHVTLVFADGADPARVALSAAWFVTRLRAIDKRLRLTVARDRCVTRPGELVLAFAPLRGGVLAAEWLEKVKPNVRELAAEFDGAEVRSVDVIVE